MPKANKAVALPDTTTTTATAEEATSKSVDTAAAPGNSVLAGGGGSTEVLDTTASNAGVVLVDSATAVTQTASVVDGGGSSVVDSVVDEGHTDHGQPKTAAEALAMVKRFYTESDFSQAVAELNKATAASANSIAATRIGDDNFYRVLSPLEHNQKFYGIGSTVVLTAEQAAPLLDRTVEAI